MELSELGLSISPSLTMAITAKANELKQQGKAVIGMSAGEPDMDTPQHICDAGIRAIQEGKTRYTAASGLPVLKEAICERVLKDQGLSYEASQVVVSCGAKHSIFALMAAFLNPGDEVVVPAPYWVSYPDQLKMLGVKPVVVTCDESTAYKITAEKLASVITPRTKLLILNSPSNPTGMVYTKEELSALGEVILRHDIFVLSDEIYGKLVYGTEHVSIATLSTDLKEKTFLVDGVAKAYAMTGWRIGYAIVPQPLAKVMGGMQSHSTSNPCTPAQYAALAAFSGSQDCVEEMRQVFDVRRQLMVDGLNNIQGVTSLLPQGAFYAFPNISAFYGKRSKKGVDVVDSLSFCAAFLDEYLVAAVPGIGFGADQNIRLSYATSEADIQEALSRLQQFVSDLG
ncbi:MAG: pyridoxal phosphate-dependent aminotransferase [bacterium]